MRNLPKTGVIRTVFSISIVVGGLFVGPVAVQATTTSLPKQAPSDATAPPTLRDSVVEVLDILDDAHLLPEHDNQRRRAIIQAIIEALDCNGALAPPARGSAADREDGAPSVGRTGTVAGIFGYIQILALDNGAAGAVGAFLEDVEYGHYEGLICDLRYTGGAGIAAATDTATLFGKTDLPLIILINSDTVGPAEMLAKIAKEKCHALTVGQPTKGYPFPLQQATLRSGDTVLFPGVSEAEHSEGWEPTPIQPDVVVEHSVPREELHSSKTDALPVKAADTDRCLRRAVDLLTTIRAFDQKHF